MKLIISLLNRYLIFNIFRVTLTYITQMLKFINRIWLCVRSCQQRAFKISASGRDEAATFKWLEICSGIEGMQS